MDVREKLVELLSEKCMETCKQRKGYVCSVEECRRCKEKCCGFYADYLIANGVTVQEWISVKERLPQEKVDCIVHYKHAYCDNDDYWAIGMCFYDGEKFQLNPAYKVTHWMPLPKPPEMDGGTYNG